MRFLIENENNWVAVRDSFGDGKTIDDIKITLKDRFQGIRVWFSDLDETDADSPAKRIVKRAIGTNYFDPKYLGWCLNTAFSLSLNGKSAESITWMRYVNNFLRTKGSIDKVKNFFTEEVVKASLYPGVEEFYSLMDSFSTAVDKYYLTRNIAEVAQAYAQVLGFNGFFSETEDKCKIVEKFIKDHPEILRYGFAGDSLEDEEAVDVLNHYLHQGTIESVVTLYRGDKPIEEKMKKFLVQVPKDRTGLVEILKG